MVHPVAAGGDRPGVALTKDAEGGHHDNKYNERQHKRKTADQQHRLQGIASDCGSKLLLSIHWSSKLATPSLTRHRQYTNAHINQGRTNSGSFRGQQLSQITLELVALLIESGCWSGATGSGSSRAQ